MPTRDGDDPALVMAMPGRELQADRGFVAASRLGVLADLADESWFATPAAIADDPSAREVRLGVLAVRGSAEQREALVASDGRLLHHAAVPPEAVARGPVLAALRNLALASGAHLLGCGDERRGLRVELVGWLHEPALPELRRAVVLVYRLQVPDGHEAPTGGVWVSAPRLHDIPLDPLGAMALAATGWVRRP